MKISNADMEKIEQLKDKVNKAYSEIEKAKVEEGKQWNAIETLKQEIATLKRTLSQPCELPEDEILWDLQNKQDDAMKIRDDQIDQLTGL